MSAIEEILAGLGQDSEFGRRLRAAAAEATVSNSMTGLLSRARHAAAVRGLDLTDEQLRVHMTDLAEVGAVDELCAECRGVPFCRSPLGRGKRSQMETRSGRLYRVTGSCDTWLRERAREAIRKLFKASRLPPGTERMSLEEFDPEEGSVDAFRRACAVAEYRDRRGIIFSGLPGRGKTHLAVAVLRRWLQEGRQGVFGTVPDLLEDLRPDASQDQADDHRARVARERASELMELLRSAELLVLDDLGTEKPSAWTAERLFMILNGRELNAQITVVTTNKERPSELIDHFGGRTGEAIVSRLLGLCEWVPVGGTDHRITDRGRVES